MNADYENSGAEWAVFAILFVPAALWGGFCLSALWGWFLVPLGVPAIGVWHAFGIEVLVLSLTPIPSATRSVVEGLVSGAVVSLLVLAIGWFVHAMMMWGAA